MKISSYINFGCLLISMFSLSVGYIQHGYWVMLPVFSAIIILWMIRWKFSDTWHMSVLFCATVAFAAIGLVIDLSFPLMSIVCIAILISWDLTGFKQGMLGFQSPVKTIKMGKRHLQLLALMCITSLTLDYLCYRIHLKISFWLVVALVVVVIACFLVGIKNSFGINGKRSE